MLVGAAEDVVLQRDPALAKSRMDLLKLAGLDTVRVTAQWSGGQTELPAGDATDLGNTVDAAKLDGLTVVDSISPSGSSVPPISDRDRADFVKYAVDIVQRFPSLRDF